MTPNVDCGCWVMMMQQCTFISCSKVPLWCKMLIIGKAMRQGVGNEVYGKGISVAPA